MKLKVRTNCDMTCMIAHTVM